MPKGKGEAAKTKSIPKAAKNKSNPKAANEAETSYRNPSNVDVSREDLIVHESKEEALASLSESARKIDLSEFKAYVDKMMGGVVVEPDFWMFNFYLMEVFSQVSPLPWFNMLKTSPLSDVPLSHIPKSVYKTTAADLIKKLQCVLKFVTWALDRLLIDWAAHAKGQEQPFILYQVATLVELAMVLRADPHSLTRLLSMLRWRPRYRGEDKLPLIVWMMSHAFQQDLPAALHSWAVNLLPLVFSKKCSYSSQSIHLILQFVEMILSSNQEARDVFLNEPVRPSGMRLIPPHSFEMLLLLACPARVEEATTERFQAIYPLLKEVALAPDSRSAGELKHIFAFSLKFAGLKEFPALASEATAIAFSLLTQNVDCFMQWDVLYKEYLEASVALLKKLVDERWWIPKLLSSSPTDNLIFEHAMNSFMMKNEIAAIIEEVANLSLYQEADYLCKLLSYLNKSNLNAAKMDPSDLKLVEDKSYGVSAAEEIEKAIVSLSLSEAAKKMDPSPLAAKMDPSDLKTNHTVLVQLRKLKRR